MSDLMMRGGRHHATEHRHHCGAGTRLFRRVIFIAAPVHGGCRVYFVATNEDRMIARYCSSFFAA